MIQLVAPPQTVSEMLDGHREVERGGRVGHPGPALSLNRRQQKMSYKINLTYRYTGT